MVAFVNILPPLITKKTSREKLTENTTIIAKATDRYRLLIKEAVLIIKHSPSINKQYDNFTNILKLHAHRNNNLQTTPTSSNFYVPPPLNIVPSAPPLDVTSLHITETTTVDSPVNTIDTQLNSSSNPPSFSSNVPPIQTNLPLDNNPSSTARHVPEPENSISYPQNHPTGHFLQPNNLSHELPSSSQSMQTPPSTLISQNSFLNDTNTSFSVLPHPLPTETSNNTYFNDSNSILQNADSTANRDNSRHTPTKGKGKGWWVSVPISGSKPLFRTSAELPRPPTVMANHSSDLLVNSNRYRARPGRELPTIAMRGWRSTTVLARRLVRLLFQFPLPTDVLLWS